MRCCVAAVAGARLGEQREDTRRSQQQAQAGPNRLREALQQIAEGPGAKEVKYMRPDDKSGRFIEPLSW